MYNRDHECHEMVKCIFKFLFVFLHSVLLDSRLTSIFFSFFIQKFFQNLQFLNWLMNTIQKILWTVFINELFQLKVSDLIQSFFGIQYFKQIFRWLVKKVFDEKLSDLKEIICLIPKACEILEALFKYFSFYAYAPLNKKYHRLWIKQLIQDHNSILKEILTKTQNVIGVIFCTMLYLRPFKWLLVDRL